jgi:hypothetical protein
MPKPVKKQMKASSAALPPKYAASIFCSAGDLPTDLAKDILELETILQMPVWCIVQNEGFGAWSNISSKILIGFRQNKPKIEINKPMALLIDSPGGQADNAYRIARMLQNRTGNNLHVLVPQYAKSAATLLALAASKVIVGEDGELGPLDVQIFDANKEQYGSALNSVQSLEHLSAFALTIVDQTMKVVISSTQKKIDVILPQVFSYATSFLRPLLEKIDTVDYTSKIRDLKVAEEYLVRLLRLNYKEEQAVRIAGGLVKIFPDHGFVIDRKEALQLGIALYNHPQMAKIQPVFDRLVPHLNALTVIGRVEKK